MKNFTFIILFFFTLIEPLSAQIVIGTPKLGFTQACANSTFNTFYITFTFTPETGIDSTNQFIIQLSDSTGSFTDPTTVYTSTAGSITTSSATLGFSLPTTTAGDSYKVRVKSTSPIATSSSSSSFSAYYKPQDSPFTINGLISTAVFCSGGSYLLTIDNPGTGTNDSPLNYSSLTYNWYEETSETTSVLVGTGSTYEVTEAGTYFVETNYGSCSSDSYSNRVTVSEATSGSATTTITSSLGNPYCSSDGPTILTSGEGESYQWYLEGVEISGATSQTYSTNEPGLYSVIIDLGTCVANATIDLENTTFTSSIDVANTAYLEEGETLIVTVTTDATSNEYEWYLDDVLITSATSSSYEVSESGSYRVELTQTSSDCTETVEFLFTIKDSSEAFPDVDKIPNLISPNGDDINDTWVIPTEYTTGTNTQVTIMSSQGKVVFETNDYQNNWPENEIIFTNTNPVYYYIIKTENNKVKKGSITIVK
jgi:gliding motility-associated-like protein